MVVKQYESPDVAILQLDEIEEQALHDAGAELYPDVKGLSHIEAFNVLSEAAPETAKKTPELYEALAKMATHEGFKVMVVDLSLPDTDKLPPTPDHYLRPEENPMLPQAVVRGLILGMMRVEPFGYTSQQPGNVINNVVALKNWTDQRIKGVSGNAIDTLGLHTEDASYNWAGGISSNGVKFPDRYNISPDWLTLQFFRNPDEAATFVSAPNLGRLSDKTLDTLSQPYFHNLTNPSQQENGQENNADVSLGIVYDGNKIRINADGVGAVPGRSPEEATWALDQLKALMNESVIYLPSKPGNVVLIDNSRAVHGRAKLPADKITWGENARWQQRVVGYDDASTRREYMDDSNVIDPNLFTQSAIRFAANHA